MLSNKEIICPENLLKIAKTKGPIKAVIVNAGKAAAIESTKQAVNEGLIDPIFIGDKSIIEKSKQNAVNDLQSGVYRSDWKKADVFENDLSKTSQFALEKLGFGADEIHNIADPRAIMALDMARRFAETSKKVQTANKKVARKPKVLKGGAKTSLKAGKNRVVASAQEAFDKNPSRANAMALMKAKRSSKT